MRLIGILCEFANKAVVDACINSNLVVEGAAAMEFLTLAGLLPLGYALFYFILFLGPSIDLIILFICCRNLYLVTAGFFLAA